MLGFNPISSAAISGFSSGYIVVVSLVESTPIMDVAGSEIFTAAGALIETTPVFSLSGAEIFVAMVALVEANPVMSDTVIDFIITATIAFTEGLASIAIANYNALIAWQAAPVDNSRAREIPPTLQELRTNPPMLKQTRQKQPMLGE